MTYRLHILRHAKSSWADEAQADHDRPLAPRGIEAGARLRQHLARREDVHPALVACSTAVRARQTLELVLPSLGTPHVVFEEGLYLASASDLLARLRTLPEEAREAMLVGHNPGLHELALALTGPAGRAELEGKLPTGALVALELPVSAWTDVVEGEATLASLVKPRDL